jgi:hypothetical protein
MTAQEATGSDTLREELRAALKHLHLRAGKPSVRQIASDITGISHSTVHDVLNGQRLPSWSNVERIVKYLNGDIASIRELWLIAAEAPPEDSRTHQDFASQYRQHITLMHNWLPALNYLDYGRPTVKDIYVLPEISPLDSSNAGRAISAPDFLETFKIALLTGDPGSGKTSFCRWIMLQHATAETEGLPFMVALRDLANQGGPTKSIADHIKQIIASTYQLEAPDGIIDSGLNSDKSIVIFDGLDEVPQNLRDHMMALIELFHARFPACRIIVTVRSSSYHPNSIDLQTFRVFRLNGFTPVQIEEFRHRWATYYTRYAASPQASDKVLEFARTQDQTLLANPLLLTLTVALANRSEIASYSWPRLLDSYVDILLRRWDTSRGIDVDQNRYIRRYTSQVLGEIAYSIWQGSLPSVISDDELTEFIATYLANRVELADAYSTARELIQFFAGRTGIFIDIGASEEGVRVFSFATRSFLDYFLAFYLVRSSWTSTELVQDVSRLAIDAQWASAAEVAVYLADRMRSDGGAQLLGGLLELSESSPRGEQRMLKELILKVRDDLTLE